MTPDTILGSFNFAAKDPTWFEDKKRVASILDAIIDTPLGKLTRFAGQRRAPKKAASSEAVHALIATGKDGLYALNADPKVLTFAASLAITRGAFGLEVYCYDAELAQRHKTVIDDVVAVAVAVRNSKALDGLRWGYVAPVVRQDAGYDYPRPRPPRTFDSIASGAIADTIDLTFHRSKHADAAEGARKLAESKAPAGARRTEDRGLVVVRWVDDISDVKALQRGCAAHEDWLGAVLPSEIDGDYNELGDAPEPMGELEPHAPLTMFDASTRTGYVAVLAQADGKPASEPWDLALKTAKAKKLPDGTTVDRIRIVVQLRDLAIALTKEAKHQGLDGVLYPADDGTWWDPDPPGDWAYPPRPNGEAPG